MKLIGLAAPDVPYECDHWGKEPAQRSLTKMTVNKKDLSEEELAFCEAYLEAVRDGLSEEVSARNALLLSGLKGIPKGNETMALTKPRIAGYLSQKRRSDGLEVTVGRLSTKEERAAVLDEFIRKREGMRPNDVLKALELRGKQDGDFIDRTEIKSLTVTKELKEMTEDELYEYLAKLSEAKKDSNENA